MRKRIAGIAAAAATLLVGASLTAAVPAGATQTHSAHRVIVPATGLPLGMMPTASQRAKALRALRSHGTAPAGAFLTYYGGPVVSNASVVKVLWGAGTAQEPYLPQVDGTSTPGIDNFFAHVGNSAYFSWLKEYNTTGNGGTGQTIGYGNLASSATITPPSSATTVDDTTIQATLAADIGNGTLPPPTKDATGNINTIYALYFPYGITITMNGSASGQVFCAYHGTMSLSYGDVPYMILPDPTYGGMGTGCGPGTAFQNLQQYTSHELIETVTDPAVGLANTNSYPLGWYDNTNGEIGDICNGQQATVVGTDGLFWTVQKEFSNTAIDCIAALPTTAPPAPSNLGVTTPTAGSAHLTWTAPASDGGTALLHYTVYRSTSSVSPGSAIATVPATQTTFDDSGLSAGTTYYYSVTASNIVGEGGVSNTASTQVLTAPSAPTSVSAAASGSDSITVTWAAPASDGGSAVTGYQVTRFDSADPSGVAVGGPLAANATSFNDTGLATGTAYTYQVAAMNAIGTGTPSGSTAAVTAVTTPSAPQSPAVVATGVGAVQVSWSAPSSDGGSPILNYAIYRSTSSGLQGSLVANTADGTTTQLADAGLAAESTQYYTVIAVNAVGGGVASSQVSVVVPGKPGAPTAVTATPQAGGQVTVSWSAPADNGASPITGYTVTSTPGNFTCTSTSATQCTVNGLVVGDPYTFAVTATNAYATSDPSTASSTVTAADVPGAPSLTNAVPGNGSVRVYWNPPASNGASAITHYTVSVAGSSATCQGANSSTSCVVSGLKNGTSYTFTVTATNTIGTSANSNGANATPRTLASAPTGLHATFPAHLKTTISWGAPKSTGGATITSYVVRWSTNGHTWSSWTSVGHAHSVSRGGIKKGVKVWIDVAAVNVAGRGPAQQLAFAPTK